MRWLALVATVVALAVGGCDLVFPPGHNGATVDAKALIDADLSDLCPGQTPLARKLGVLADADIASAHAITNTGAAAVVQIDGTTTSYGLFKFDIGGLPVDSPKTLLLTLRFAEDSCGVATCLPCMPGERRGNLTAYAMVSDWQEGEVTWEHTGNGGRMWNGASGGTDHLPVGITTLHDGGNDTRFVFGDTTAADAWLFADHGQQRLSFLIQPEPTATMAAAAKDGETTCSQVARASLDLVFCQ